MASKNYLITSALVILKKATDPRHLNRQRIVQKLYTRSFHHQKPTNTLEEKIIARLKEIDNIIGQCAPQWPVGKIAKVDLAILRLSVYELLEKKTPPKVIIDEAVELGKEFGGEKSPSFINGVLGSVLKKYDRPCKPSH